jgi:hypothetical protein
MTWLSEPDPFHARLSRKGVLSGSFKLIEFWDASEFHWF